MADSSHLVSAFPRILALYTRTRICENKSREHNKDEDASLREGEDTQKTRIHRENMKKTSMREREDVNKARKLEIRHESARYTAQLETVKRVFVVPSRQRKLKQRWTDEEDIVSLLC